MRTRVVLAAAGLAAALCAPAAETEEFIPANWKMRAFCVSAPAPKDLPRFCGFVTNTLAPAGVNTLVLSIHYRYHFKSHPECTGRDELTDADVRMVKRACDSCGVRLVPKMNLLGHQETAVEQGLFTGFPELEEFRPDGSRRFGYSHSICPKHPNAKRIVYDLVDEVVDAFGADLMHVGCDEVFEIGRCPLCRDTPPHELYADWVNGLSRHLKTKGVRTMIWSDRLLNSAELGYNVWEASDVGTDKALPLMDRDILCCDWHYGAQTNGYPSVDVFAKAGMQMLVCPWRDEDNTRAFFDYANRHDRGHVKGVVFTTWIRANDVVDAIEGVNAPTKGRTALYKAMVARNFQQVFPKAKGEWSWYSGEELPLEGGCPDGETRYDRLPGERLDEIPPAVQQLQRHTAGMCFRFRTGSRKLRIWWKPRFGNELEMWHMPSTGMSGVDVYQWTAEKGWQFVLPPWPAPPRAAGAAYTWIVEPNAPTIVNLPLYNGIEDVQIGVERGAKIEPAPPRASGVLKPVVFYGTSTTQGGCVSRPGLCWTSVASRLADVPQVNLGFSGAGKMEDALLDRVARIDASLYVLDTIGNMDAALIRERFEKFVRGLKARRPNTPILLTLDGWHFAAGFRARVAEVKRVYAKLKAEDPKTWANLHLAGDCGDDVAPDAEGTMDGVHLNDLGSRRFGEVIGKEIRRILSL